MGEAAGFQPNEALPSASGVESDIASEADTAVDERVLPAEPFVILTARNSVHTAGHRDCAARLLGRHDRT